MDLNSSRDLLSPSEVNFSTRAWDFDPTPDCCLDCRGIENSPIETTETETNKNNTKAGLNDAAVKNHANLGHDLKL